MLAQGNALGSGIHRLQCALKGRRIPFHPFRAEDEIGARYPGRCPGLVTSAPLARHRGGAFNREKLPMEFMR
jgi:hypothetical protein